MGDRRLGNNIFRAGHMDDMDLCTIAISKPLNLNSFI